ncbi:growth arrest-specific protein 1 [Discoglossus pictus]
MAGWAVLCILLLGSLLGVSLGRRLVCWQALLQCQEESECSYAYRQYLEACDPVLPKIGEPVQSHSSSRRRCPSHCISALIQLNHTRGGPALEDCDCAKDEICKSAKRAIEPCLPKTGSSAGGGAVMGCTEARHLCESDRRCSSSLNHYLLQCNRLFNGLRCTDECKAVIGDMMQVPKALLLNDCVCDGMERPICESIKENMARLCFGSDAGNGPGSSGGSDYDYEEDYDEEQGESTVETSYEEEHPSTRMNKPNNRAPHAATAWTVLASAFLMVLLL